MPIVILPSKRGKNPGKYMEQAEKNELAKEAAEEQRSKELGVKNQGNNVEVVNSINHINIIEAEKNQLSLATRNLFYDKSGSKVILMGCIS